VLGHWEKETGAASTDKKKVFMTKEVRNVVIKDKKSRKRTCRGGGGAREKTAISMDLQQRLRGEEDKSFLVKRQSLYPSR